MLAAAILFIGMHMAMAQEPTPPEQQQPPPPEQQQPPPPEQQQPPPPEQQQPPPPEQQQPPPPEQQQPPPPEQQQQLMTPLPPNLSSSRGLKKLEQAAAAREKSPFMIPNELYLKLLKKRGDSQPEVVDLSIEPKRRWALKYYQVVAVIWNVKQPKAMIYDKDGVMHLFREKDYIGNQEGFIVEINNGEVVVLERGTEHRLKLKR